MGTMGPRSAATSSPRRLLGLQAGDEASSSADERPLAGETAWDTDEPGAMLAVKERSDRFRDQAGSQNVVFFPERPLVQR